MAGSVRKVAKRIKRERQHSIYLINEGHKTTRGMLHGKMVDTTQKTLEDDRKIVSNMDRIIDNHGGSDDS
jgi:hypothetical protein